MTIKKIKTQYCFASQALRNVMLLCILFLAHPLANAASTVEIAQDQIKQDVSSKMDYFVDTSAAGSELGIADILDPNQQIFFQGVKGFLPDFGYTPHPHWFRLKIINSNHPGSSWILYNYVSTTDYIDVYFVRDGQVIDHQKSGDRYLFSERSVPYHKPSFPFTLATEEGVEVYVKVQTEGTLTFPLFLNDKAERYRNEAGDLMFDGFFFGGMAVIIIYNLFLLFLTREKNYFYFLFFSSSLALAMANISGYTFEYLWPDTPAFNSKANLVLIALAYMGAALFAADFIDSKQLKPRTQKLFLLLIIAPVLLIIGDFVLPFENMVLATRAFSLVLISVSLLGIVEIFMSKDMSPETVRSAKSFLAIWIASFGAILLYFLDPKMGMLMLVTLLSLAFGDKVNRIRAERIRETMRAEKLQEDNLKLAEQSSLDSLTHLKNQKFLDEFLSVEYGSAHRQKESISMCIVDLDGFEAINEKYGREAGDAYLVEIADLLKKAVQRPRDIVARSGGEEFSIVLPATGLDGATLIAERVRDAIENRKVFFNDDTLMLTASVGISTHEVDDLSNMEALVREAGLALNVCMESGKNQVKVFGQL